MFTESHIQQLVWFISDRGLLDAKESFLNFGAFLFSDTKQGKKSRKAYINARHPYEVNGEINHLPIIINAAIENGHDSIIIKSLNKTTYAVFTPSQVEFI